MSVKELTTIISPKFSEETVREILATKSGFSHIKLTQVKICENASKKGDSYLSEACRFRAKGNGKNQTGQYEDIEVPVIVKYFHKNSSRRKTFRAPDFFKTEIEFYRNVWPQMKRFKSSKIPDEADEVPLVLASYCDGINDFIAMEDLGVYGFKSTNRKDVLDGEKISMLLELLANFHALGMVLSRQNPEFKKIALSIRESFFHDNFYTWYNTFLQEGLGRTYKQVAEELLDEHYSKKVNDYFNDNLFKNICESLRCESKFSTVTQGDSWLTNFLIKYNDNRPISAVLIDFQITRYSSIANDLIHFIYTAVPRTILEEKWNDLIAEYYVNLTNRIDKLGGDKNGFTLEELKEEILERGNSGLLRAMESTIGIVLDDCDVVEDDELEGEEAVPLESIWVVPELNVEKKRVLAWVIKHAVDVGLLK